MSLINDALKEAGKAPPGKAPGGLPFLPPGAGKPPRLPAWFLPGLALMLILAAIFFLGWAVISHGTHRRGAAPQPLATRPPAAAAAVAPAVATPHAPTPGPAPTPVPSPAPVAAAPAPVQQPVVIRLQGIFYSATAPSAILNGTTVRTGDLYHGYRVKTITRTLVTLVGPDKREYPLKMGN